MISKHELFTSADTGAMQTQHLVQTFEELIPQQKQESIDRLRDLSLRICSHFDFFIPNLGSLTFDLFFDRQGKPYLISMGGFEQNGYLCSLSPRESWEDLINRTVGYCWYLLMKDHQEGDGSDGLDPHQAIRIAKKSFQTMSVSSNCRRSWQSGWRSGY